MRWSMGDGTRAEAVEQGARLAAALGVPGAVGRILWARGHKDAAAAQRFLEPKLDQLPDPFGLKGIDAAVGVAFHLLLALRKKLRDSGWFNASRPEPNLREQLDLVALGTIADVVPLTGPNRILVHFGLKELARGARPGVLALKSVAQLAGDVSCGDVGFKLGPRINAAGRLDDASVGVRLLLTEDLREARKLAAQLDKANTERQELQARIAGEAIEKAAKLGTPEQRRCLVVSSPGWHAGVVGIVASRLVEKFHRPALVLAEDGTTAKGSGRSVEGFHLYDALARCGRHLTRFGGHKHAAGMQLPTSGIGEFADAIESEARTKLDAAQLTPRLRIDAELQPAEIGLRLAEQVRRLAPFGAGNPEPVFVCSELTASEVRLLPDKKGVGPGHLKLRLSEMRGPVVAETDAAAFDAIGFSLGGMTLPIGARLDAAFQLAVDSWN